MARKYDDANEMDKDHPLSPQNQERYGLNDRGIVGAIKNWKAAREDDAKHYKQQESNLAGFTSSGLEDTDYYMEYQALREQVAAGRKIVTNTGEEVPFTRDAIAQKIQEGFQLVHVNFENQRTAKLYTYLSNENMPRGASASAPFTYSPDFNTTLAGKAAFANVIVKSITQSLKNIMGMSASLESAGINLKQIGGGGYIGSDQHFAKTGFGIEFGGGRHWGQRGEAISAGMRAGKQGGQNATQVLS